LKIASWRFSGRWSAKVLTNTCASSPALALDFGSGDGCAAAVRTVDSPSFLHAYLMRTCSITVSFAGV
jgi:hypothetical protein